MIETTHPTNINPIISTKSDSNKANQAQNISLVSQFLLCAKETFKYEGENCVLNCI